MVKQVIDGKAYNTETARHLATADIMGHRMDERGRFATNTPTQIGTSSLYQTRYGLFFLVHDFDPKRSIPAEIDTISSPLDGGMPLVPGVTPLRRKQALAWAENKDIDPDKIEEMFGQGSGDQTGAILLRLPQTLKLAIEKSAAVAGVSTNTWLMRCAERCIASEREQKANP
jgi:hypothetical protein